MSHSWTLNPCKAKDVFTSLPGKLVGDIFCFCFVSVQKRDSFFFGETDFSTLQYTFLLLTVYRNSFDKNLTNAKPKKSKFPLLAFLTDNLRKTSSSAVRINIGPGLRHMDENPLESRLQGCTDF